jgi:hypothetical protein
LLYFYFICKFKGVEAVKSKNVLLRCLFPCGWPNKIREAGKRTSKKAEK